MDRISVAVVADVEAILGREIEENERQGLMSYMQSQAEKALADYIKNELREQGCWCTGFDHRFECRHNPMNQKR